MMKTKNMLWMSALLALLAGCSQGELGTDDAPGKGVGKEIRLVFSGGGESQEYTRAIASERENQIDNLDIYVQPPPMAETTSIWKRGKPPHRTTPQRKPSN